MKRGPLLWALIAHKAKEEQPGRATEVPKAPILLTDEIKPPPALIRAGIEALPAIVRAQGERASRRFIEFFTASIRNRNTRIAYARAVKPSPTPALNPKTSFHR